MLSAKVSRGDCVTIFTMTLENETDTQFGYLSTEGDSTGTPVLGKFLENRLRDETEVIDMMSVGERSHLIACALLEVTDRVMFDRKLERPKLNEIRTGNIKSPMAGYSFSVNGDEVTYKQSAEAIATLFAANFERDLTNKRRITSILEAYGLNDNALTEIYYHGGYNDNGDWVQEESPDLQGLYYIINLVEDYAEEGSDEGVTFDEVNALARVELMKAMEEKDSRIKGMVYGYEEWRKAMVMMDKVSSNN